jgi:hypothetical protein
VFHDRLLIIDDTVYHIGASLKDLGRRLFAVLQDGGEADGAIEKYLTTLNVQ